MLGSCLQVRSGAWEWVRICHLPVSGPQPRDNGRLGRIALPNVDAITPARHRYHATAAVTRPRIPPAFVRSGLDANAPKLSRTNTTARIANRNARPAVVRSAATTMRVVKIAHAIRNHPAACPWLAAGTSFA